MKSHHRSVVLAAHRFWAVLDLTPAAIAACWVGDSSLHSLACRSENGVVALDVTRCRGVSPATVAAIASGSRATLQSLRAAGISAGFGPDLALYLASLPHLRLAVLDLDSPSASPALLQCFSPATAARLALPSLRLGGGGAQLGPQAFAALAEALRSCPLAASRLQSLTLSRCPLDGSEPLDGALSLLPLAPSLRSLVLEYCSLGDAGACRLAQRLPAVEALRVLGLRGNGIGERGAAALASGLSHSAVGCLDLRDNRLGDSGVAALGPALRLGGEVPAWEADGAAALRLGGNFVSEVGARALAHALAGAGPPPALAGGLILGRLSQLDLSGSRLRCAGAEALAQALAAGVPVSSLTLYNCSIGAAGVAALAAAVAAPRCAGLLSLHLGRNAACDTGAVALASALATGGAALTDLNLSFCGISAQGGAALLCSLAGGGGRLRRLSLRINPIGDDSVKAAAAALLAARQPAGKQQPGFRAAPCCLEELVLGRAALSVDGVGALAAALAGGALPRLRLLDVSANDLGTGGQALVTACTSSGQRVELPGLWPAARWGVPPPQGWGGVAAVLQSGDECAGAAAHDNRVGSDVSAADRVVGSCQLGNSGTRGLTARFLTRLLDAALDLEASNNHAAACIGVTAREAAAAAALEARLEASDKLSAWIGAVRLVLEEQPSATTAVGPLWQTLLL